MFTFILKPYCSKHFSAKMNGRQQDKLVNGYTRKQRLFQRVLPKKPCTRFLFLFRRKCWFFRCSLCFEHHQSQNLYVSHYFTIKIVYEYLLWWNRMAFNNIFFSGLMKRNKEIMKFNDVCSENEVQNAEIFEANDSTLRSIVRLINVFV